MQLHSLGFPRCCFLVYSRRGTLEPVGRIFKRMGWNPGRGMRVGRASSQGNGSPKKIGFQILDDFWAISLPFCSF